MLRRIGFFRELRHGQQNGPSLHEALRSEPQENEQEIARYLSSAEVLATTGSLVGDVLDSAQQGVAPLKILTDGDFVWPADLAYYVANYHVSLPEEFVSLVRQRGWLPPDLGDEEMESIEERFLAGEADR